MFDIIIIAILVTCSGHLRVNEIRIGNVFKQELAYCTDDRVMLYNYFAIECKVRLFNALFLSNRWEYHHKSYIAKRRFCGLHYCRSVALLWV